MDDINYRLEHMVLEAYSGSTKLNICICEEVYAEKEELVFSGIHKFYLSEHLKAKLETEYRIKQDVWAMTFDRLTDALQTFENLFESCPSGTLPEIVEVLDKHKTKLN